MLKTILIIFLFLLFLGATLFGVWYLVNLYSWPLWIGALIVVGIFGTLLGLVLLRRYMLRNNERKFVKRVIAQEGSAVFASNGDNQLLIDDLEKQWQKSIEILYGSKLSKGDNPIYALPWFVVLGESGSGKTSLMKNSRLSSALTDIEETAKYSGTKNCDWWFFEDAIILDTAGRYTVPIDGQRDNAEWERFLALLTKYRKKEPLNGIVIAISAERLLENDKDLIQEEALSIRKRIDQLMISIGAKFPVYLMVTKMDRVYGFTEFSDALPQEHQAQAMGYMNEALNFHWDEVIDEGVSLVKSKIRSLELFMIQEKSNKAKDLLLFSQEFNHLIPALKDFSKIIFGDNPYQKIPLLRGIYFSSALSDGKSNSKFLSDFNLSQESKPAQNKAYFISEFFQTILPNDRNIFIPIKEYLSWQRRNYKIAIAAWIFIFIPILGIYAYSYMQNISVIQDIDSIKKYKSDFQSNSMITNIILLDKLRLEIIKIDELNHNVLVPSVSFKQSQEAERNLKKVFQDKFNNLLYRKFTFKMSSDINKITSRTPSKEVVSYIGFFIDSIDILKQVLDNKDEIKISKHFSTWIENILLEEESKIDPNISALFINNYIAYLKWNKDKLLIKEQITTFRKNMALIVDKKGSNLHWLTDEGVSQVPSIKMSTFFTNIDESLLKNTPSVSGSLTLQGRANLVANINALVKEMDNPKILEENLKLFWKWYDERFYYRWRNFALSFKDAQKFLHSNANAQSTLYSMSSDTSPYFTLMQTMAKEFKAYKSIGKTPAWTKLVIELDSIMGVATNIRNSKNSLLSKVGSEKDTLVANVEQTIDNTTNTKQIKSAILFNKYVADLISFSIVVDKKKSQLLISDFFSDTPSKAALSPSFSECQNHYNQFKHSSPYYANSEFIYELVSGPKDYIINYSIENMNHVLNTQWKNMVLGSIPLSTDSNLLMSLFDKKKGLVWKFVQEQLQPFVVLNRYGYNAKKVSGFKLDITPSFLRYINSGINLLNVYKPQYNIKITTLPFDINSGAKVEANFVSLHLTCAKQDYILDNDNYKLSKTFTWRPSKCGDTILTFSFNDFKVKKTYKGENGFLYFLKDFKDGTHIFSDKDFDQNIPQLKQQNIKSITLSYNISGEGDMLKLLDKTPYNVPKKVTNPKW